MILREILDLVVASAVGDWHVVPWGERALTPTSGLSQVWTKREYLEVNAHYSIAVHKQHPEISLAWGFGLEDDLTGFALFADPKVSSMAADVRVHGSVVHRNRVLVVDGARGYLPLPGVFYVDKGEHEFEAVGDTVSDWDDAFVRLIDQLSHATSAYDSYFKQSGFMRGPGHPLDTDKPPDT